MLSEGLITENKKEIYKNMNQELQSILKSFIRLFIKKAIFDSVYATSAFQYALQISEK